MDCKSNLTLGALSRSRLERLPFWCDSSFNARTNTFGRMIVRFSRVYFQIHHLGSAIAKLRGIRTISLVRRPEVIDELKAAGPDVVLMDEPAAVEDAVCKKGRFGWRLIQWAVMQQQRSFN